MKVWVTDTTEFPHKQEVLDAAATFGASQIISLGSRLAKELNLTGVGGYEIADPVPETEEQKEQTRVPLIFRHFLEALVEENVLTPAKATKIFKRLANPN